MYRCLYSKNDYFNLPQMYTTSLFHSSLIDKVRRMQNGKFLTYGISDANMAAISVTMEKKYLYSELPLGWVGTSPKVLTRSKDFIESIKLHYLCGNYRLGFASMYFLGALLTIETSNKKLKNKLSNPKKMEKIISSVYKNLDINSFKTSDTYKYFLEVLKINEIDLSKIIKKTAFIKNAEGINKLFYQIMIFPWRCIRYMLRRMPLTEKYFKEFNLYLLWVNSADITMQKASEMVLELMKPNLNFKDL